MKNENVVIVVPLAVARRLGRYMLDNPPDDGDRVFLCDPGSTGERVRETRAAYEDLTETLLRSPPMSVTAKLKKR